MRNSSKLWCFKRSVLLAMMVSVIALEYILIAGDPGTAKSHLLKAVPRITNGSRYVSADNLTQAELTGACSPSRRLYTGKKRWSIVPGALALTPKEAICCVDEFNLYKGDAGDFNNAMESGMTTINKIVKGTVYTECSVLAGANPNAGVKKKFARDQDFVSQLGLDVTVMQRFDAIFILLDDAKAKTDKDIAMSMLGFKDSTQDEFIDLEFIQKYIAHAKAIDPVLTLEAATYISDQHSKKRQESKDSDYFRSHRQVASLKRFSLAAARFDLSETVEIEHVKFAESIMEATLGEQDPGLMVGAQPKESREHRQLVARKFIEYVKEKNQYENLDPDFIRAWMAENDLDIDRNTLVSMLTSMSKNVDGLKKNGDGTFEYGGSMNQHTVCGDNMEATEILEILGMVNEMENISKVEITLGDTPSLVIKTPQVLEKFKPRHTRTTTRSPSRSLSKLWFSKGLCTRS